MKQIPLLLVFLIIPFYAPAASDNINPVTEQMPPLHEKQPEAPKSVAVLDHIIELTKENLRSEMKLRDLVLSYQELRDAYLEDTQNKKLLAKAVRAADEVEKAIITTNLEHAFPQEFLKELAMFAKPAKKQGFSRP